MTPDSPTSSPPPQTPVELGPLTGSLHGLGCSIQEILQAQPGEPAAFHGSLFGTQKISSELQNTEENPLQD